MANDKRFVTKNGLATQNISFVDDAQSTNNVITAAMSDIDSISFNGDNQLFSITDDTEGTIFAVTDNNGLPLLEIDYNGTIRFAEAFGNVLIGTTIDDGTNKIQINGDITLTDRIIHFGNANTQIRFPAEDTVSVETAGVERIRIDSVGNVGIGTTTPSTALEVVGIVTATDFSSTSDIRLKTNLEKITNALEKLQSINGYTFTIADTNQRAAGVIAQEIEQVLPEVVHGTEEKKTVSYGNIVALLIEAIKEQQLTINNLADQIAQIRKPINGGE